MIEQAIILTGGTGRKWKAGQSQRWHLFWSYSRRLSELRQSGDSWKSNESFSGKASRSAPGGAWPVEDKHWKMSAFYFQWIDTFLILKCFVLGRFCNWGFAGPVFHFDTIPISKLWVLSTDTWHRCSTCILTVTEPTCYKLAVTRNMNPFASHLQIMDI